MIQYHAIPYKQQDYIYIFAITLKHIYNALKNYNKTFIVYVLKMSRTFLSLKKTKKIRFD